MNANTRSSPRRGSGADNDNNKNENATAVSERTQQQCELDDLLLQSLAADNLQAAREALDKGAQSGTEALWTAACQGNVAFIDLLLDYCQPSKQQRINNDNDNHHRKGVVDVNGTSPDTGLTALHHGVLKGHVPTVCLLLEKGHADPNVVTTTMTGGGVRYSPLQCLVLATEPNLEILQLLLDYGANVHDRIGANITIDHNNNSIPLLHLAQHTAVVQTLLQAGGPAYAHVTTTPGDFTALHTAAADGHVAKMLLLLNVGGTRHSDVADSHGETALHWACAAGQVHAVQVLLQRSGRAVALLQQCNHQGQTPFMVACAKKQIAVALFLWNDARYRSWGCNPWQRDNTLGYTALHWLCDKSSDDSDNNSAHNTTVGEIVLCQLVQCFMTVPGLVKAKSDLSQCQALHLAAQWSVPLSTCLIRHGGARVATQEPIYGRNAILQAAQHGCLDTLVCLLELETEQTVRQATDKNGWGALHWAAWNHRPDMMRAFLRYTDGASSAVVVNAPNKCGRQPMHLLGALGCEINTESNHDKCLDKLIDIPSICDMHDDDDERLLECISILVHAGANLRTLDSRGDLPFCVMAAMERVNGCFVALRAAAGQGVFDGNALQRSRLLLS